MSGYTRDQGDIKIYREHSTDVALENKAPDQGATITAQDTDTGEYTYIAEGDEQGWVYCAPAVARPLGSYAHVVPVIATDGSGAIAPIASQDLDADVNYEEKTVVLTAATNDHTKARSVAEELPAEGDKGLVVQCLAHGTFEQLFYPAGGAGFQYIEDLGDGTGRNVVFDSTGTKQVPAGSETLTMQTLDPVSFFHDSTPPLAAGRIYPGRRNGPAGASGRWLIFLPGHGSFLKTLTAIADGYSFEIDIDGQGNVLDIRVVAP